MNSYTNLCVENVREFMGRREREGGKGKEEGSMDLSTASLAA